MSHRRNTRRQQRPAKIAATSEYQEEVIDRSEFSREQLVYLAGIFDASTTFRSSATEWVAYAATEEWPRRMAKLFGGYVKRHITSQGNGKTIWQWNMKPSRKLELITLLEQTGLMLSLTPYQTPAMLERLGKAARVEEQDG